MKTKTVSRFAVTSALALSIVMPQLHSNANAENAVLVNENFDSLQNGMLPSGWKVVEGQGTVQDGKLLLSSTATNKPARVVVPLADDNNGNYVFEADMTFKSAVEDTRWASLMYRVQNDNYPYYQFAVRRGTTALNGIEFAERTEKNAWNVMETNFHSQNFEYDKSYRLKVVASKNRVQQYINGQLVIDTAAASKYSDGTVGFQAAGSTVQYDNVKVTPFNGELPDIKNSGALLPEEPATNMVNAPTLIAGPEAGGDTDKTSSALLKIEESNGTLLANGEPLVEQLQSLKGKKIPVLHVEQIGLEEALVDALNETTTTDVQVVSSDTAIVEAVKDLNPKIRGGLYYGKSSLNKHDLQQIAEDVHGSGSKMVMIPQHNLIADNVYYLHNRMVSVWGIGGDTMEETHALLHAGVDGIVTNAPSIAVKAFGQYPENTIIQRPIVAAHRGVPSQAPENTMAGYRLAYDLGADQIETDVQRTKDGQLVIMHDNTVDRTTNGTGAVDALTLEEIRALDAGVKYDQKFAGEKVPTFKEFLQGFKGKNVLLLVELKDKGIEQQVIDEIKSEGMMDQVSIQSFYLDSMQTMNNISPELPIGYLFSASVPKTVEAKLQNAKKMVDYGTMNDVNLNASYGSIYEEYIQYSRQRGQMSMHWTFRAEDPFAEKLKQGMIGPITDYTQWLTASPIQLETPIKKLNLNVGKTHTVQAKAKVSYRVDQRELIKTELFVAEDNGVVKVNGNTVEAVSRGTAQVFVKHTFTMLGQEWNLVSEPLEVTVK
ncbi:glycerophosphodiester phosphodiesterase family protein [Fictibacillus iocasae]|uniref:Glycerophosphodiester phosphodiesterase family protein n=1 Tax=Fictibacillus iocasae TaxID=2715437 RepID=A0ABW2NTM0_9BACL